MKNERGLTLIELLASLAISTLILGVSFVLLSSVFQLFNNTTQKYNDNKSINLTMNTISDQLAFSSKAVYYAANHELRYKIGKIYKSLVYDSTLKKITLYTFSETDTVNEPSFKNASINLINNNTLYSEPRILSNMVTVFNTSLTSTLLINGELFTIDINFLKTFITSNNLKTTSTISKTISIKLLDNFTDS